MKDTFQEWVNYGQLGLTSTGGSPEATQNVPKADI